MTDDELKEQHRRLLRGRYIDRESAALSLRKLSVVDLVALARLEMDSLKLKEKRFRYVSSVLVLLAFGPLFLLRRADQTGPIELLFWFWLVLGLIWLALYAMRGRLSRLGIADALAHSNDPEAVTAALTLLEGVTTLRRSFTSSSPQTEQSLRWALSSLLPKVKPAHTIGWSDLQRNALLLVFTEPMFDVELSVRTLRVVAFAGTGNALKHVRKLARCQGNGDIARIRQAATDALPILEARLAQLKEPETLLRPVAAADESVLLRAPGNAATLEEETLVRPIDA